MLATFHFARAEVYESWRQGGDITQMRFAVLLLCFQVSKNGLTNSVFTLYELASGDDTENEGSVVGSVPEKVFRARLI